MDNTPRDKQKDSSWNEESDRITNPNRRQEEEGRNPDTSRDQRASRTERDPGSSESVPSSIDEQLHGDKGSSGRRTPDE